MRRLPALWSTGSKSIRFTKRTSLRLSTISPTHCTTIIINYVEVTAPDYSPYFHFQANENQTSLWFMVSVTFLNPPPAVHEHKPGGFAVYQLSSEDPAISHAFSVPRDFKVDNQTRQSLEL